MKSINTSPLGHFRGLCPCPGFPSFRPSRRATFLWAPATRACPSLQACSRSAHQVSHCFGTPRQRREFKCLPLSNCSPSHVNTTFELHALQIMDSEPLQIQQPGAVAATAVVLFWPPSSSEVCLGAHESHLHDDAQKAEEANVGRSSGVPFLRHSCALPVVTSCSGLTAWSHYSPTQTRKISSKFIYQERKGKRTCAVAFEVKHPAYGTM